MSITKRMPFDNASLPPKRSPSVPARSAGNWDNFGKSVGLRHCAMSMRRNTGQNMLLFDDMDVEAFQQRLQTLKAEMESIRLASVEYLKFKTHTNIARMAHQSRTIRLEAIVAELAAMTRRNTKNG